MGHIDIYLVIWKIIYYFNMKKKICILHPSFTQSGGAERKLLLIAENLKDKYDFDSLSFDFKNPKNSYLIIRFSSNDLFPFGLRLNSHN